ncbi:MAG: family 2 glycosyl transferase, partial [Desulfobacteraceae bacterium]
NWSLFRKDYIDVDGFDETYDQSWGREDSDICYRLFHAGIRVKILWFTALQYHLYHKTFSKWDKERLDGELSKMLQEKRVRAVKGLSKLSPEGEVIARSDKR